MHSECLALPNESDDMHLTGIFSCYYLQRFLFFLARYFGARNGAVSEYPPFFLCFF